jgi:hypothetical protein
MRRTVHGTFRAVSESAISILCILVCLGTVGCSADTDLTWHDEDEYRWAEVSPGYWGSTGFERLEPSDVGVEFTNRISKSKIESNQHYLNGSGVAAGDVDGDGLVDLYFALLEGPNRLYKNTGNFKFREITDEAGVSHENHYSTGTVFSDVDNDGDLDLLIGTMSKGVSIYKNENGRFEEVGVLEEEREKGNMTLATGDINKDGYLDLYVTNYKERTVKGVYGIRNTQPDDIIHGYTSNDDTSYAVKDKFKDDYKILEEGGKVYGVRETGEEDALYINDGDGRFSKANPEARFSYSRSSSGLPSDWGLHASFRDITGDGHLDIYVNNDFWTPDRIWINQGDGTFRGAKPRTVRNMSLSSMGADFSDVNRDGAVDIFVTDMLSRKHKKRLSQRTPTPFFPTRQIESRPQYNRNSLYLNRGDDTYAEVSHFSGVAASEWSWATRFMDVDLDGYEDLIINTGFSYDYQDLDTQRRIARKWAQSSTTDRSLTDYPSLHLKNVAFRNDGDLTFSDRGSEWGLGEDRDISHGLATADFDNDGDLDLAISRLNQVSSVYENKTTQPRIAVRLSGDAPNARGIGAKVTLTGGKGRGAPQQRQINTGDYLSGSQPLVVFAADPENSDHAIQVTWNDGSKRKIEKVRHNRIYQIIKPSREAETTRSEDGADSASGPRKTVFADVSGRIGHQHQESAFDDFRYQPLLPIKLSKLGPGVSWIDYDTDGDDDLFIGSGRGGRMAVFENNGDGRFSRASLGPVTQTAMGDQATILGWPTEDGVQMVVGKQNYEEAFDAPSALRYTIRNTSAEVGKSIEERKPISGIRATTGPMAAADYTRDGTLDLFVGGRFIPVRYPSAPTSRLFKNSEGEMVFDRENSGDLNDIGMVTGAVFTDYDQDGDQDLLLSRAWGSLVLFRNDIGGFKNVTSAVELGEYKGWWSGVASGDFNNDGRMDFVATNWGTNSPYQTSFQHPLKMYYHDFKSDGIFEVVETYYDSTEGGYVPRKKLSAFRELSMPFTSDMDSSRQFAGKTMNELVGAGFKSRMGQKTVNTLKSAIFINEGGQFSRHLLPGKVQFSAALHAGVADYNNDGNEDIFISQNFFQVPPKMPRPDAGRGLWLKGNGKAEFEPVSGQVSGVRAYGEQRGAALSDFNRDGKVDLAVSQNGATTKLYTNRAPKSGLSVRLSGPSGNRAGIGSSIRLVYPDGSKGPRREVQSGSGYWSQDSATQVLGFSRFPDQIEVTWFDGSVQMVEVNDSKKRYTVEYTSDEE